MKGFVFALLLLFSMLSAQHVLAQQSDRPPAPTGVNATDGASEDYVKVSWIPVAGVPLSRVHRCSIISGQCTIISNQAGSSFTDTKGKRNTIYDYRVRACEHLGECSELSDADQGYRGFVVSAGQSGSWYDPSHDGEGFFLQVVSNTEAVVFWFTYDDQGNQFWMTGVGTITGAKIEFPELIAPRGGKFGPDFDPADVSYPVWGSLKFDFSDCDAASVSYTGPKEFGKGKLDVIRLTRLWGLGCGGDHSPNISSGTGFLNAGFSGSWYDIDHSGEGFAIEILNETTADVMWFTFDTQGNPAWITAIGQIAGTSILVDNFQITSGATFGSDFNSEDVNFEHWGVGQYNFSSCGGDGAAGSMQYIPPVEWGPESGQLLYRLTSIAGIQCEKLISVSSVSGSMNVAENIFIDGDVNDPNTPEVSNDLDAQAQVLNAPAQVVGYATALATGVDGDRFATESDEWDIFQVSLQNGETVTLDVSDWITDNPMANDLDLYLWKLGEPDVVIDSSENATRMEWVSAPQAGVYLVGVHAQSGTSKYLLKSGQSSPIGSSKLSSSAEMAESELIAAIRINNDLTSDSDQNLYRSRIEGLEKRNGLTRVKVSTDGDVLYALDSSRIDRLVPHPLAINGRATITPENWQVIRTAKELSVSKDYRWSGPNYILHGYAQPVDPLYSSQWHYPQINLPQAWNMTTGRDDVVVAVIDSGVFDHPDLVGNVDYSIGYDFVASPQRSGDGDGLDPDARDPGELFPDFAYLSHGTHVAGTVGAVGNNGTGVAGVNWDVTLMPVRVLGIDGSGSCWDIGEGMKWAGGLTNHSAQRPARTADVINMSLGGGLPCDGGQEIVNQLTSRGVIVIAAAGNDATSLPNYPAALDGVISVSATTIADELAPYSTFGPSIDIAAPGGDMREEGDPNGVLSTVMIIEEGSSVQTTDYSYSQGTSMASPHVAGVAALMKSVYPEMESDEFFNAVSSGDITKDLADDGLTIKDPFFGYGRIDAEKATNWALEQSTQPIPPYLRSSISFADFGSTQLSIMFDISAGGTGPISVTGGSSIETWIQLFAVDTDDDGLGTYRIDVNRSGLVDGAYSGQLTINASDGSELSIPVAMQVGEKVAGEAGYQHVLLLNLENFEEVVIQWAGLASDSQYDIAFSDIPFGFYTLLVGSDVDNDSIICGEGEFCQLYPLNAQPDLIFVGNEDVDLGLFTLSFPVEGLDFEVPLPPEEIEPLIEDSRFSKLRDMIKTSGISIKQ